jgi:hypothetical protein
MITILASSGAKDSAVGIETEWSQRDVERAAELYSVLWVNRVSIREIG